MPKTKSKPKSLKQKQSQKQSVKQTVIVRLDREQKKKRKYKRRRPRQQGIELTQPSLPAPVIYQSNQIQQVPVPFIPEINLPLQENKRIPAFQDVGVGTEGFVEILDQPTKKETLADLITPVPIKAPLRELNKEFLDKLEPKKQVSMKEPEKPEPIVVPPQFIPEPKTEIMETKKPTTFNFAEYQPEEEPFKFNFSEGFEPEPPIVEKPKAKNPLKKRLPISEEQRAINNAKARARYAKKKAEKETEKETEK